MDDRTLPLALRFLTSVVPKAVSELARLRRRAGAIEDPAIRREALSSLRLKAFHVHGGCVFATALKPAGARSFVKLAAVYETAVDYLDNLCDRIGSHDERDFRALHEALIDAVTPGAGLRPYFRHRAHDDSGYLAALVTQSQAAFAALPGFQSARPYIAAVTRGYCELQALKHLARGTREERCASEFSDVAVDLRWWEGAAASGSTMATFALAYGATDPDFNGASAKAIYGAYFPYFTALHILLDYFVDQDEDRKHGELNFVTCYPDVHDAARSMTHVAEAARTRVLRLPDPEIHVFALRAMCGFYCTRPTARTPQTRHTSNAVMQTVGIELDPKTGVPRIGDRRVQPLLKLYARMARSS